MKLPTVNDSKRLETVVVLAAACLVFGLVFQASWLIYVALGLLVAGVFVKPVSHWLAVGWLAMAEVLGKGVSFVLLSVVFLVVLTPIAVLGRTLGKTPPPLRRMPVDTRSFYTIREHEFGSRDFEKTY